MEFNNCGLLILRKGFPNKPKQRASRIVDLPLPFSPTISVVEVWSNETSIKLLPVDKKLRHLTTLKIIILLAPHIYFLRFLTKFSFHVTILKFSTLHNMIKIQGLVLQYIMLSFYF